MEFNLISGFIFMGKVSAFLAISILGGLLSKMFVVVVKKVFKRSKRISNSSRFLLIIYTIEVIIIINAVCFGLGSIFDIDFNKITTNITLIAIIVATPLRDLIVAVYGGFSLLLHTSVSIGKNIGVNYNNFLIYGTITKIRLTFILVKGSNGYVHEIPTSHFIQYPITIYNEQQMHRDIERVDLKFSNKI